MDDLISRQAAIDLATGSEDIMTSTALGVISERFRKMTSAVTDNRFKIIEKYKQELIENTNIETSPEEMAALDDILFRFWQMGWLDKIEINSKDAVNRQEAINKIKEINSSTSVCVNLSECYGMKRMQELAMSEIENMPSYRKGEGE